MNHVPNKPSPNHCKS